MLLQFSESLRRKKIQVREKVGKSRNAVLFQWFVAPEGGRVGSLKRRVRSHVVRWESKSCTPLWREAHFEVKSVQNWRVRTTFGSWDIEKVHADVARSTFPSQNVQSTPCSDHFWKLRCRKSARRCGAKHISKSKVLKTDGLGPLLEVEMSKKHISKSKCTKHTRCGPLLAVEMSKKCTPLWREAHFKNWGVRRFGLSDVFLRDRQNKGFWWFCTLPKVSKTWRSCSIFYYNHHYTTLRSTTLHYNYNDSYNYNYNCTTLRFTNHIPLHYATLHDTTGTIRYT